MCKHCWKKKFKSHLLDSALSGWCVNEHANAERLCAWIKDPLNREPANLAFTEGPDRQVAYHVESAQEEERQRVIKAGAIVARDVYEKGRAEAFEEAARIADNAQHNNDHVGYQIAEAIRAKAKEGGEGNSG